MINGLGFGGMMGGNRCDLAKLYGVGTLWRVSSVDRAVMSTTFPKRVVIKIFMD